MTDALNRNVSVQWLHDRTNNRRANVSRFQVSGSKESALRTVIVKQQISSRDGEHYNTSAAEGPAWRLFNEWSAYEFAHMFCSPPIPSCEIIGGDRKQGLIVLEDLGDNVDRSPFGQDREQAERYLIDLVRRIGAGRHSEYATS